MHSKTFWGQTAAAGNSSVSGMELCHSLSSGSRYLTCQLNSFMFSGKEKRSLRLIESDFLLLRKVEDIDILTPPPKNP